MTDIDIFIERLADEKKCTNVINLYKGNNRKGLIRKSNLRLYLYRMKEILPETLLLGEAPGYKGCRITGIPFSSEKILTTNDFFKNKKYQCFHKPENYESEISATIVWEELDKYTTIPLIWNIFPFHPHKPNNQKSNRPPTSEELEIGKEFVKDLLKIYNIKKILALGRKAESQIADMGIKYTYIRHPANGGKRAFVGGLKKELK